MPAVMVRNIPEETVRQLRTLSKAHHRSVNGEILHLLASALLAKENEKLSPASVEVQNRVFEEVFGSWIADESLVEQLEAWRSDRDQTMGREVSL